MAAGQALTLAAADGPAASNAGTRHSRAQHTAQLSPNSPAQSQGIANLDSSRQQAKR
jgi:hypothetical protein